MSGIGLAVFGNCLVDDVPAAAGAPDPPPDEPVTARAAEEAALAVAPAPAATAFPVARAAEDAALATAAVGEVIIASTSR